MNFIIQGKKTSLEKTMALIAQKTRNYAKRQEIYWRRLEKKLSNCLVITPEYTSKQESKVVVSTMTTLDIDRYSKKISQELGEQ